MNEYQKQVDLGIFYGYKLKLEIDDTYTEKEMQDKFDQYIKNLGKLSVDESKLKLSSEVKVEEWINELHKLAKIERQNALEKHYAGIWLTFNAHNIESFISSLLEAKQDQIKRDIKESRTDLIHAECGRSESPCEDDIGRLGAIVENMRILSLPSLNK